MKKILIIAIITLFLSGCATWQGMSDDADTAVQWGSKKIDNVKTYIK